MASLYCLNIATGRCWPQYGSRRDRVLHHGWSYSLLYDTLNKSILHLSDSAFRVLLTQVNEKCTNSAIPETRGSGAWLRFSDRLIIKLK